MAGTHGLSITTWGNDGWNGITDSPRLIKPSVIPSLTAPLIIKDGSNRRAYGEHRMPNYTGILMNFY